MKRTFALVPIALLAWVPVLGGGLVVGEKIAEQHRTSEPYSTEDRAVPEIVWSRTLHHPRAVYIAPHFSWFDLPPGDHAIVRSPDGKQSWRYEGLGRADLGLTEGGFWSGHIRGDTAVVELWSRVPSGASGFGIDGFARGLTDKEIARVNEIELPDTLAICGPDDSEWAKCYLDSEPQIWEQSRAVARLLIDGVSACTGWLVGCEGHLITNEHCIGSVNAAQNTDYEFMAEGATCATNCAAWGGCPGTVAATSGQLLAVDAGLDYALVKLPGNLSGTYGYMRLRAAGPEVGERIWIPQHPSHWGKRIAVLSTHGQDQSGFCEVFSLNSPSCSGSLPDVGYYCDTQGGSSGSPVVAYEDQRVVALHHCANCPNRAVNIADVIADLGEPNLPDCALAMLAGETALDRSVYSCSDLVVITVEDDSLIGAGTQEVEVWSATESAHETVLLTEQAAGVFRGSIATVPADAIRAGDGAVAVSHGETITVRYLDLDDGTGGIPGPVDATASTDCLPPVIDKVDASDVTGNAATITWDTDEPADSTVVAGTGTADGTLVGSHSVRITGLAECSAHAYSVSSADAVGNVATDDRGGALHTFVTGKNTRPELESTDTPRPIPDNSPAGASSTVVVSDGKTVIDVNVAVHVTHPFTGDLKLTLTTPSGATIVLANQLGGSGNDYDGTVFDDEALTPIGGGTPPFAGPFKPIQALSAADGIPANGAWTLKVEDTDPGEQGVLDAWTLILTYPPQLCGPHARYQAFGVAGDQCAAGAAGGNGVWDAGERVQFSLEVANDGSDPLTAVGGTVVPLTQGVVAVLPTAGFGDLAVGALAGSATHFVFDLPQDLDCGDPVQFRLDLGAAEGGVWSQPFQAVVGQVTSFTGLRLKEGFQGGLPAAWSVIDGSGDGRTWFADAGEDPTGCDNLDPAPPLDGAWAAVDSDCAGTVAMDESLVSPPINLLGTHLVTLGFDHWFNRYESEIADVDVRSSATAGAWVNVARYVDDTQNPARVSLDITDETAGAVDAQVRFRYRDATFDWFWYVDNVEVKASATFGCNMVVCAQAVASPAPIPDGTDGTAPVRASRTQQGTGIVVDWDDTCDPVSSHVLYGDLDGVSSYTVAGALCNVGDPVTWEPAPTGDVWFLLVSDDGAGVESSWGQASDGTERHGLVPSGECGTTAKDVSATCP